MTRDYARRPPASRRTRRGARPGKAPARSVWSASSFSAGAIFGATLVLLASYAPTVFRETVVPAQAPASPPPPVQFDFEEILTTGTVTADTSAYPARFPEEDPNATPPEYLIQAISVRSSRAAARLAEELNGAGLPSRWERADLASGTWYRVLVGPFHSRREANRAMVKLRERNMTPRLSKLG